MAKTVRSKTQARKDKSALKKLFELGIIRKPDLRKNPTKNQREKIKAFAEILSAKKISTKASGVKARSGETLFKTKSGEIVGVRKIGGSVVKTRHRKIKAGEPIEKPERQIQYAIPFIRGRDSDGEVILEWVRWPSWTELQKFMKDYESKGYKDWADYVIEEELGEDDDDALREKLERKMKRRAKTWQREARGGKRSTRKQKSRKSAGRKKKTKRGR